MHHVLDRQIKHSFGKNFNIPPEWSKFLELVSDTYTHFDEDRELLNRSLEISSKEFLENSFLLKEARLKVEKQAQDLAHQVTIRTDELNKRVSELEDVRTAMTNLLEDFEHEQKKSEILAKDLEKFKLAVENVSDSIVITDYEGTVIYANRAVEKITGYTPEETIGKKSGVLWKTPMSPEYYHKLWDTIKKQKKSFSSEIQHKRKNGEAYTSEIRITPILNKENEIEFFVGIERDISREKEIDRLKDEFVSIASHELRTPLTAIDGLVSMILEGEYGPISHNLAQPLTDINTSSERLIRLVNDLLNLSRIQAGRLRYAISNFSISDKISKIVTLLQPAAGKKGLEIKTAKLNNVNVQGDSDKIEQIFDNLIGNSLKFTDKGTITIATRIVGDKVEVLISDTGIGIGKEDQTKLFGIFQQLESSQGGRPIGTGLGLHISREMARKMGGDVWLEKSDKGAGSTFAFSLPQSKSMLAEKVKREIEVEAKENPDQKAS